MANIVGGVLVTGFISPTDTSDTYAVIDPIYGIDGLRSVTGTTERNSITTERRREGMLVYVQSDGKYYKLLPSPWTGTNSDWEEFTVNSSGGTEYWSAGTGTNSVVQKNSGSSASGDTSVAEGYMTNAVRDYSHSEGAFTTAGGTASHAEGQYSNTIGASSHAEGDSTTAVGNQTHSEGYSTTAFGEASHAQGAFTAAVGNYSHSGGFGSVANGYASFVHGENSNANGNSTIVLGSSITGDNDNTTYVDYLNIKRFPASAAVNTLAIDGNGNVVSGTYDMTVTGGTYNPSTGTATFTNNSGGTFDITGFLTGYTDTYTTGTSYNYTTNQLTISGSNLVNYVASGFTKPVGPSGAVQYMNPNGILSGTSSLLYTDTTKSLALSGSINSSVTSSIVNGNSGTAATSILVMSQGTSVNRLYTYLFGTPRNYSNTNYNNALLIGIDGITGKNIGATKMLFYMTSSAMTNSQFSWAADNANTYNAGVHDLMRLTGFTSTTGGHLWVRGSVTSNGIRQSIVSKTSNYTLTSTDYTVNCTTGSFTITLPSAVTVYGQIYYIKNTGAGTITIATTSSQTIDGNIPSTYNLVGVGVLQVQSDGSNWIKLN